MIDGDSSFELCSIVLVGLRGTVSSWGGRCLWYQDSGCGGDAVGLVCQRVRLGN